MSNSTTILRTATVTAIFATLSLGAAHANGNTYLKHSYARSAAARHVTSIRHAPAPRRVARRPAPSQEQWGGWASWGGSSSSSSTANLDDEVRHIDEMNRMQQQQNSDAMNATIQATNAQNAAAQQQIQLQQDLANMPTPAGN
jgi:hypothetical protein